MLTSHPDDAAKVPGTSAGGIATGHRMTVHVVDGPDKGKRVSFDRRLLIGKLPLADLVLSDPQVDSLHCEILNGDIMTVRDLGSKSGVFVGLLRIIEALVPPGEPITIGRSVLRVHPSGSASQVSLREGLDFHGLLGASPVMRALIDRLALLARSDATVLIQGETGTGKERVATALHLAGPRASGPLVVVDCGALPPTLVDSELCGHERGAFTGAVASAAGAFERADGGTLFLDEIGDLPIETQPKFLRLLESRTVKRIGGDRARSIDVRVVAATHRDLATEVKRGRFRDDLYFRLAVVTQRVAPLRERSEDIPFLAAHFLSAMGIDPSAYLTAELQQSLLAHDWPGNVRELRNYLTRIAATREPIRPPAAACLAPAPAGLRIDLSVSLRAAKRQLIDELERAYVGGLLEECGGKIAEVARRAGMDRMSIYRIVQRLRLRSVE